MIKDAIAQLTAGQHLTEDQAAACMDEIMSGQATPAQFGAFVTALRIKGETVDEIVGMARVMRDKAVQVQVEGSIVDTCGTGGDNSHSFNVSTAAGIVAAAGGVKVAKHGNRSMTSQSGSADVLEALGVKIDLGPEQVAECLNTVGFGFMFAQSFHPAMKYAAAPRREIGIRTVFNILGPLTNPAHARNQVLGVAEENLTQKMASALQRLGAQHAMVVHGTDGLDEISLGAPTIVAEVRDTGAPIVYSIDPAQFGFSKAERAAIRGGTPADNAERMRAVFAGERSAYRDVVILNAAAALTAGGVTANMVAGVERAAEILDTGAAQAKLEALIQVSNRLGG